MDKQTFMVDKLYSEILTKLQAPYADIGMNKLAHDYDGYTAGITKLIAVGQTLNIDINNLGSGFW